MKKICLALFVVFITASFAFSQPATPPSGWKIQSGSTRALYPLMPKSYTVATLPTGATNDVVLATDCTAADDCSSGSGTHVKLLVKTATGWTILGDGAATGDGDVGSVGDCTSGACFDGTSDGGQYIRLYDGDSHYTAIVSSNVSGNVTITLPAATGTLLNQALAESYVWVGSAGGIATATDSTGWDKDASNDYVSGGTDVALADGGTGASLSDPGADRIMFWDDTAGAVTWLTVGTGLTITDTTITASGSGDVAKAGDCEGGDCFDGSSDGGTYIRLYDGDSHYTSLASSNVSSNTAIVLPATAGTLLVTVGDTDIADGAVDGGTGGEIADDSITAADLSATLTFADGDYIDLSAITHSANTAEGLVLPTWANVAVTSNVKGGTVAWDETSDAIKIKSDAGWQSLGATAAPIDATYLTASANGTLSDEANLGALTTGLLYITVDAGVATPSTASEANLETTLGIGFGTSKAVTAGYIPVADGTDLEMVAVSGDVTMASTGAITIAADSVALSTDTTGNYVATIADAGSSTITVVNGTAEGGAVTLDAVDLHCTDCINATEIEDIYVLTAGDTMAGNLTLDDGTGASPSLIFQDATDETWTISKADAGDLDIVINNAADRTVDISNAGAGVANLTIDGTLTSAGLNTGTGSDGSRAITMQTNTSLSPTGNQIYYENDVLKFSEGGGTPTEKTPMKLEDAQTATGVKTFQAGAYFGDASNQGLYRLYDGSSNYWIVQAPTGMSGNYTLTLPGDDGANGQSLLTDGSGVLSWGSPTATAAGSDTHVQFNDGGSALGGDASLKFNKTTGDLTVGSDGEGGAIILYNELGATDYNATIAPNGSQAADVTITLPAATSTLATLGANTFTGAQALGANNLTMTGSLAATGARVTKGWFTDIESTNLPTVGGATISPTNITPVDTADENATFYPLLVDGATGTQATETDGELTYNPSTDLLSVANIAVGALTGVNSIDATGAVDMDYGSADVTDHTFVSDGGTVVIDGSVTAAAGVNLGTSQALTGTTALTIGDNNQTVAVNSSDWDIGATGDVTGLGAIGADGLITFTNATEASAVGTAAVVLSGGLGVAKDVWIGDDVALASDGAILNFGADSDVTLTHVADTGLTLNLDLTIGGSDLTLNAAGVKLTGDGDGALTILGLGDGYDEDLTINLDDTENKAVFSSSTGVTELNFSALNLATTGTIQGAVKINTDANGMSSAEMTAAGLYGSAFFATGAGTWALPGAAAGMSFCIYSTTAAAVVVNPDDGDAIVLNGTALSAGDSITSASGAGDFICLMAYDANTWYTLGRSGTWTDTN